MQVALFVTCLIDQVAPDTGRAAVRLLEAAGCDVEFPADQTCCGQPAYNSGFPDDARRLALHFLDVFEGYEAVVSPSGSCAAMVRHYYPELWNDLPGMRRRAEAVGERTYELTEFLVDVLGRPDLGAQVGGQVTYHASCHLLRELGVREAPRRLLDAAGVQIVEMADAERCCGFGGTFSVRYPGVSVAMADTKLAEASGLELDALVSCDGGCLLQLGGRADATGRDVRTMHLVDLLDEARAR